jgi:hypothetical protein
VSAAPPALSVEGNEGADCPAPRAVAQAVLRLIPREHDDLLTRHGVRIELEDRDTRYRVRVFKDGVSFAQTYADPARDCEGRANFAAVFAVLTIMPPDLGFATKPEPEPRMKPEPPTAPVPEAPKVQPAAPPRQSLIHLELSGVGAYAPAILDAPELTTFGGELRVALGRDAWAGTLSVAYLGRAKFELDRVQGELDRLPASVGVRFTGDVDSLQLTGELGALAILQRLRATNLLASREQHALELGVRAGIQVSSASKASFRPFAGAFVWVSPGPREFVAYPNGLVGNLPYLWLGGAVGISLGL